MRLPVIGVTGWKNSGKTTLVEHLVRALTARGFRVATIKHACDGFEIDHEGRDSNLHRRAGAQEVLISSRRRWAQIRELDNDEEEARLDDLLARLSSAPHIVVVEGYKSESHPKICVHRTKQCPSSQSVAMREIDLSAFSNVVAVVTDDPKLEVDGRPRFLPGDIDAITEFVISATGIGT